MSTHPELVPCVICQKLGRLTLTPVETICHVVAPQKTLCPVHRATVGELLDAQLHIFLATAQAKRAERDQEASAAA